MKKVNWNKLAKRIPNSFKVGKTQFKVNFIDKFDDGNYVGLSDWNKDCIYIKKNQTKQELVKTYLHECLHIFSDEFDIKLSEKQVQGLEKTLQFWLKDGNIFK
jgi:hypothetical protein